MVALCRGILWAMQGAQDPPVILTQPFQILANAGEGYSVTVLASGTPPLSYQWRHEGTNIISGAFNWLLYLPYVKKSHSGAYSVVVSNDFGSTTGEVFTLTVTPSMGLPVFESIILTV